MRNWRALLMIVGGVLLLFGESIDFGGVLPLPVVDGPLQLVIVEESENRPENIAKIVRDKAWRDGATARDVTLLIVDQHLQSAIDGGYTDAAKKTGLPSALLLDAAKELLVSEMVTGGTEQLDQMLSGVGR